MHKSHYFLRLAAFTLLSVLVVLPAAARKKQQSAAPTAPKYIFYMIGDGMGFNEVYGAQN